MEKLRIWQIFAVAFGIITVALIIAIAVIMNKEETAQDTKTCQTSSEQARGYSSTPGSSIIYKDLTVQELEAVRDYMLNNPQLNITPHNRATINSNYIYLIDLHPPNKDEALAFIDQGGPRPTRKAKVIVHAGARSTPVIEEYAVFPVNKPTTHSKIITTTKDPIPFTSRAADIIQTQAIEHVLRQATSLAYKLLHESYDGFVYHNCTDRCMTFVDTAPRDTADGGRVAWVWFMRSITGTYIFPIDFELLVDCSGTDISKWKVTKVVYNYQPFDSVEKLMTEYNKGNIQKSSIPAPPDMTKESLFTTFYPKGDPPKYDPHSRSGPEIYEPEGNRFQVDGQHVTYIDWSFDFHFRSTCGVQIFDVRFKDERIIYELSLQEAGSFYTAASPTRSYSNFLDSGYGMGMLYSELVPGWDCPATAKFHDIHQIVDSDNPKKTKNGICIFEWNKGTPLRRHFNIDLGDKKTFYGALQTHVLIVRSIASVYNYDYVYDYIFHLNGVVEVKVSLTGYLLASYYTDKEKDYAIKVHDQVAGSVHDHMLNYKVDLDIGGRENSFEFINLVKETTTGWNNEQHTKKKIVRELKSTENEAIYKVDFSKPKYLNFFNENQNNANGVKKGYRLDVSSPVYQVYPDNHIVSKMAPWSKYQVAVTKYKKEETTSSSIYNQNSAHDPVVDFDSYLNNEGIINQDLVAWVSIGTLHIPCSEDLPTTFTDPNHAKFYIRPFNYFDEDPSINSRNTIVMTPKEDGSAKIQQFGTESKSDCVPEKPKITYTGFFA